jgi:hypothetical protein
MTFFCDLASSRCIRMCAVCERTAHPRCSAPLPRWRLLRRPQRPRPNRQKRCVFRSRWAKPVSTMPSRQTRCRKALASALLEPMLEYDYFARPVKLVPRTLESMPVVSDAGKTIVLKFARAFSSPTTPRSKGRNANSSLRITAYSLKRLLDPKVKSPWQFLIDRKTGRRRRSARRSCQIGQVRLRRAVGRP